MSILLAIFALAAVVLVGGAVLVVFLVMRGDRAEAGERLAEAIQSGSLPTATDVAFFFRFEGADAEDAAALIAQQGGELSGAQTREAALGLRRLVPSATHAYLGPCAWPPVNANAPVAGGLLVGFRARTRVPLDTVADDRQLTDVNATLSMITHLPDAQLIGGLLTRATDSPDPVAPVLVPVDGGAIPGHRPCPHCRTPIPVFATRCTGCGGRAMQ